MPKPLHSNYAMFMHAATGKVGYLMMTAKKSQSVISDQTADNNCDTNIL